MSGEFETTSLQLSHRNHFRFGYNGIWFTERKKAEDRWNVAYGRCERPVADWRTECINTARLIREATSEDLWVLFSGGIDSEVVVQSFMFAGIPFKVAITCFDSDLNRQDVRYAVKFCETHQIPYRLLKLDIIDFFESGRHSATPQLPNVYNRSFFIPCGRWIRWTAIPSWEAANVFCRRASVQLSPIIGSCTRRNA